MGERQLVAKILLFVDNVAIWICGILCIIFGSIGVADSYGIVYMLRLIPGVYLVANMFNITPVVMGVAIFMIILGSFLFFCGGVGLFSTWKNIKRASIIYVSSLIAAIITEIALIIFAAVNPTTMTTWIQSQMAASIIGFRPVTISPTTGTISYSSYQLANAWEIMQFQTQCCGANGPSDYTFWPHWNRAIKISNGTTIYASYPPSCCPLTGTGQIPTNINQIPNFPACLTTTNQQQSCTNVVMSMVWNFSYIAIIISCCLIAAEIIGFVLTLRIIKRRPKV